MSADLLASLFRLLRAQDPDTRRQGGELLAAMSGAFASTPLIGIDLSGLSLRGIDLRGARLCRASLRESDLQGADLRGVDLRGANLLGADLRGARLEGAHLGNVWIDETTELSGVIWGRHPGLALLNRRDCYVCGASGAAPCLDLRDGSARDDWHDVRWRPHVLVASGSGLDRCTVCGGAWPEGARRSPWGKTHHLCPNRPLHQGSFPGWLLPRSQLRERGLRPDDRPDAFWEQHRRLLPLFDLRRLKRLR